MPVTEHTHTHTHTHTQMRVLRNDFARYNLADDEADELDQDDYGWKIINTDVFRFPPHKSLLCAVIGMCCHFTSLLGREVPKLIATRKRINWKG